MAVGTEIQPGWWIRYNGNDRGIVQQVELFTKHDGPKLNGRVYRVLIQDSEGDIVWVYAQDICDWGTVK